VALLSASVSICGAGDVAVTAGLYLAAAGVGCLRVSSAAAEAIEGANPDCHVIRLATHTAVDAVEGAAAVLCAGADTATCARLGAACVDVGVPWLIGNVADTSGWVRLCRGADGPCTRCLAHAPEHSRCDYDPLAQMVAGMVGTLLATETIKVLLNLPSAAVSRQLVFEALDGELRDAVVATKRCCPLCGSGG